MTASNPKAETKADEMTKEQAAAHVFRQVPKMKDGKAVLDKDDQPVLTNVKVPVQDVMSFKDYGDHVIVVTTAGEKLRGDK